MSESQVHAGPKAPVESSALAWRTSIWIPQVTASVMLLWALNPSNPYGYYVLLRWVCCGIFAYLAVQANERGREGMVWILGITALIYNPIFRVHLNRELWSIVNLATIVVAAASIVALRPVKQTAGA